MQILIESTDIITTLDGTKCRLWQGTLPDGTRCDVFVLRVGSADLHAQLVLARELSEMPKPKEMALPDLLRQAL